MITYTGTFPDGKTFTRHYNKLFSHAVIAHDSIGWFCIGLRSTKKLAEQEMRKVISFRDAGRNQLTGIQVIEIHADL
jgi:hypothetical protein